MYVYMSSTIVQPIDINFTLQLAKGDGARTSPHHAQDGKMVAVIVVVLVGVVCPYIQKLATM